MQSKRSFFNATLFKKHLSRFWPLWGGVSLVGAMFPLYVLLALIEHGASVNMLHEGAFREGLYQIAAWGVPAITCAYAILCVMAVWGYLYNARFVGLMHTLPVDRTCLFVTNTLAGLTMVLIPYAVTGGLLCLIALGWGFFDFVGVVNTILTVLFCALLFYGMATLCAMLTGHAFVLPVFYLLANFLAFLMEILVTNLAHVFLIGVPMLEDVGRFTFLSPVVELYNSRFGPVGEELEDGTVLYHLQGLWVVALYALAGCAMLAVSWLLYKKRHSESAGDVVAFRWLRPVFRYGVALLSGLTVGRLLYWALWGGIFQKGDYADPLPMAVCIFLAGLVGYYAASMLLEKTRRVFNKKSLPGVGIVAAGTVALCLLVSVDLFGLEKKIPAWDEIDSIAMMDRGISSGPYSTEEAPDQAKALRAFHEAIVADRDYIRGYAPDWDYEEGKVFSHYILLEYRLKDGSTLRREYDLWLTADQVETPGTYDNLLQEFYQDPVVRAGDVTIPREAELENIEITCDYPEYHYVNTTDYANGDRDETRQIYAALQKDAAEGHIPAKNVLEFHGKMYRTYRSLYLYLAYRSFDSYSNGYYGGGKEVYLTPAMTNTVNALVELGYVTVADVEQWKRDLADAEAQVQAEQNAWEERYGGIVYPEEAEVFTN